MTNPARTSRRADLRWALATGLAVAGLLSIVQRTVHPPLLLGERLLPGGGWIQIVLAAVAGGWLAYRMQPLSSRSRWRKRAWLAFACVFFAQLALGIWADPVFLLSGRLHFPVPDLILGGAVYRWQLGFMPVLFLVTVLLSGGAWCNQLCYFGAFDALAAGSEAGQTRLDPARRSRIRLGLLALFILTVLVLRLAGIPALWATLAAAAAGVLGIGVILFGSLRRKRMVHCSLYCPLGTLVSYLKSLSPWRFGMNERCTRCLKCTTKCPYGALTSSDILRGKPGRSCTQCGDCLLHCPHEALEYQFPGLTAAPAQRLWLCVCVTLYTCFLMLARI